MQLEESGLACQLPCYAQVAEGTADTPPASLSRKIKLLIRRRLRPTKERVLRARTNDLMNWFARLTGGTSRPTAPAEALRATNVQAGNVVRVRAKEEIEATLNHWGQLKGCGFMPEMERFCGTTQRVLKRVQRFVDERDLRVKQANGLVFLEGVTCTGTADFGACDRTCLFFWREEWLEKIEGTAST